MSRIGHDYLHNLKLEDLIGEEASAITLPSSEVVDKAIKVIAENHIQSLPVCDAGECLGLVDHLDFLTFALSIFKDVSDDKIHAEDINSLEVKGRALGLHSLKDILDYSGADPFVPVNVHNPVSMAADLLATGIHRVPIVDNEGNIITSFSQSTLVRHLNEHLHRVELKSIGLQTLDQLQLGKGGCITVPYNSSVVRAMIVMDNNKVPAVAVKSEAGTLCGNFSAADLTGLYREQFPDLLKPIAEYLKQYSPKSLSPVCVRPDATLIDCVKSMVDNGIHRVWVLGDNNEPSGCVSMTDVISAVVHTVA